MRRRLIVVTLTGTLLCAAPAAVDATLPARHPAATRLTAGRAVVSAPSTSLPPTTLPPAVTVPPTTAPPPAVAATASSASAASAPPPGPPSTPPAPGSAASRVNGAGRVEVLHVPTGDLDVPVRDVWVYRPAVADSASLPVVYFLHGYPGHASDPFESGLPDALDRAFAAGAAPFVVASPDGDGGAHPDTEWADATDGTDRVETFVTRAAISAVEGANPRTRADRAIAGFSMGGYGAMNLALRHPDLYGQVVSIAGYFHVDDPDRVFGGDPAVEAANAPDQHVAAAASLRVLLLDGAQDDEPVVEGESQRFKGLLDRAGIPATLDVQPGGHDWGYVMTQIPAVVAFLDGPSTP